MPKKIDDELKARAVRLANDHQGEYASLTAAAAVVVKQLGVSKESVRRWVIQAQVDSGQRASASAEELAEINALKAENRRLREDVEILSWGDDLLHGELESVRLLCRPHLMLPSTESRTRIGTAENLGHFKVRRSTADWASWESLIMVSHSAGSRLGVTINERARLARAPVVGQSKAARSCRSAR